MGWETIVSFKENSLLMILLKLFSLIIIINELLLKI